MITMTTDSSLAIKLWGSVKATAEPCSTRMAPEASSVMYEEFITKPQSKTNLIHYVCLYRLMAI